MDKNILLSKIASSPTETTWSQAYSTLNLYIVMSIKSEDPEESIVTAGKELFEKLQREYFSLDEKSLSNIRTSVENAVKSTEGEYSVSIVLSTITDDILYIVIAGKGCAVLRRHGKVAVIAEGEEKDIAAFSGKLSEGDVVIFETQGFSEKIPLPKLTETIDDLEVTDISENLAPLIHESPLGTEAAIVLQYKNLSEKIEAREMEEPARETPEPEETTEEEMISEESIQEKTSLNFKMPGFSPKLPPFGTKKLVIIAIIALIIIFAGSILIERQRAETAKREHILSEILDPAQKKFDEAVSLESLNKGLALDEFNNIKQDVEGKQDQLKTGTSERKKLEEFIGKVETKIGELSAGATLSNQKMIYDKGADLVVFRDGTLEVVKASSGEINILDSDGSSKKTIQTKNKGAKAIIGDENSIFVLGDLGVTKSDKKSGKTDTAIDDISNTVAIDVFGSNLYGLNTKTKTIDKYVGQEAPRSDYFKSDSKLSGPTSMSIDGSIWIIDGGKIRKFTKGAEDSFTVNGLTKELGDDAQIFTAADYSNIYVIDKGTTRIISIGKDGEVKNQYVSKNLSNASSFTVDEGGKKIYAIISGKLYSFDL